MKRDPLSESQSQRASPGAVIGASACTAYSVLTNMVKNPFLHLAQNTSEREAEPRLLVRQLAVACILRDRLPMAPEDHA